MKSLIRSILYATVLGFALLNCSPLEFPVPDDQKILFEVSSSNFAWGRHHSGFFIDNQGNILVYKNPVKWNHLSENGEIGLDALNENLSQTTPSSTKIPLNELNDYKSIIYTINPKKLSKKENQGADIGARVISGYVYNSKTRTYRQMLVSQTGDWVSENKDKPAVKIKNWLNQISQKL